MKKNAIKTVKNSLPGILGVALLLALRLTAAASPVTNSPSVIPWDALGAQAGAGYHGDGLAVMPAGSGARLHCVFQRLDGEATAEGLWLTSTFTNTASDRFRVTATALGRNVKDTTLIFQYPESSIPLVGTGEVSVCGQTVRFRRPGLTEEYSVSMDGVRQDFIVEQVPTGLPGGELVIRLAVSGAQAEAATDGARLVLAHSWRKLAYSRLRVTDATGRELQARLEVSPVEDELPIFDAWVIADKDMPDPDLLAPAPAKEYLAVVVNDAGAVYPVRIDPTFSDANWVSLGSLPGPNGSVYAAVTDGAGNLYIGGKFNVVGNTIANNIAQWNGSTWSTPGSGISGAIRDGVGPSVYVLAVSGGMLYAGGEFTTAGGIAAYSIAQWNGSTWSALGSGISDADPNGYGPSVFALAVSGGTLYAGGSFTNAGGNTANSIAQWNGSSWSALGSGMSGDYGNGEVWALAVSGTNLYAGGYFTSAGGNAANSIAQWNGSTWSALGSGISGGGGYLYPVDALTVSGSTLYVGGEFTNAGGSAVSCIAQWDGSSWSALGSGISGVGDGLGPYVSALAVDGSGNLYIGGDFTIAGTNVSAYVAEAALAGAPVSTKLAIITTNAAFGLAKGVFGFDLAGPAGSNVVIQASTNLQTWIPLQTNLLGSGLLHFSDAQSPANRQRFYRAQLSP
jgi:hypothetical protein